MQESIPTIDLEPTPCAICSHYGRSRQLYGANFQKTDFNREVFSARRLPDRIHYRWVKCVDCGLVRSDPIAKTVLLTDLYEQSTFEYGQETDNLSQTYGQYLDKLTKSGVKKGSLLEIGCGNGFFLNEALKRGYFKVLGVEPSKQAVEEADPRIRNCIINNVMRPGLFESNSFDTICCFQVLDHIPDPRAFLQECYKILSPGGFILCLNHNVESVSAKILGERSPIIDIEHIYLFSPRTATILLKACGFSVCKVETVFNIYSLRYLIHLLPIGIRFKSLVNNIIELSKLTQFTLKLPLGNLFIIAQK